MTAQDLNLNEQIKSLSEKNTCLSLALNTALQENATIKHDLISVKAIQNDYEEKIKNSCENERKIEQLVKKFNFQVENWKYKFKCLEQKIADLESIEKQVRSMADSLLNENQSLRSIVLHHDCLVQTLHSDSARMKKECQEKIDEILSQNERLSSFKSESESKIDCLTEQLLVNKNLIENLKAENEKLSSEKYQLELQLISHHQNMINMKNNCQNTEHFLEEKNQMIKNLEDEKASLNMELNNLKISSDYEINELKKQIKKLDLTLKAEIDEKTFFKNQLDDKVEQFYLVQLNNKELSESLKIYQDKKRMDNFTQTIFKLNNLSVSNKSTQTRSTNVNFATSSFTQTPVLINRGVSTQTEIVCQRNINIQTDSCLDLNKNLGFKKDWTLRNLNIEDLDDSYGENFRPKNYKKNENAKNLFDELISKKNRKRVRFADLKDN